MSINGVLEDLPLSDVLQFIHLGRRSGTLYMWQDERSRAEIGFYEGRIVSAWSPGQKKLGDLLVEQDLIESNVLSQALDAQRTIRAGQSIGQILLEWGVVERDQVHTVIADQIQKNIFDLVTWQHGEFHFEVDELHPIDDFALAPGELFADLDLNTQMLLLEATRIFDERHHQSQSITPPPDPKPPTESSLDRHLRRARLGRTRQPWEERFSAVRQGDSREAGEGTALLEAVRCQFVSQDQDLLAALRERLPQELVRIASVRLREAGNRMPGEAASPIVILDLRNGFANCEDIATLARTRPSASVVALCDEDGLADDALAAGAVSVVEPRLEPIESSCRNLVRILSHPQPQGTFGYSLRGGLSRFRRVVVDVQTGLLSATMALNLMHVISESVERAVLFLVRHDTLVAVGAFGFSRDQRPLAEATRGLKIELHEDGALRRAIEEAKPQSVDFDDARLEGDLVQVLGRPTTGQVVIFPVLGAERTISLIYTDNGDVDEEIQDIRILELATSQVGVAFENELLRQQLGDQKLDLVFE